jgi:two-component system, OmpR family, alkaline phosphatase synthesis response regulator PhoP
MGRIMIVDDERDVVTLLKFLLEKDGHQIAAAYNGAEALEMLGVDPPKAGVTPPDVIILDVMMPIMDGYTVSAKLATHEVMKTVPLVILSAKGEMRDLFQLSTNVATYVEKPFDPKTLRDLLTGILDKKK